MAGARGGHSRDIATGDSERHNRTNIGSAGLVIGDNLILKGVSVSSVVEAFLRVERPEEIHSEQRTLRLSKVYAVIALYLHGQEKTDSGRRFPMSGDGER